LIGCRSGKPTTVKIDDFAFARQTWPLLQDFGGPGLIFYD